MNRKERERDMDRGRDNHHLTYYLKALQKNKKNAAPSFSTVLKFANDPGHFYEG